MTKIFAVAFVLGVASWPAYAGAPPRVAAKPVAACGLLTYNDLKSIPEKDTVNQSSSWPVKGGEASFCNYAHGLIQVILVTGASSEQGYTDWFKRQMKSEVTKQPVSGVGRSAYFMFPRPNVAVLVVNGNRHTIGLTRVAGYGQKAESFKPFLLALAKSASARVR